MKKFLMYSLEPFVWFFLGLLLNVFFNIFIQRDLPSAEELEIAGVLTLAVAAYNRIRALEDKQ